VGRSCNAALEEHEPVGVGVAVVDFAVVFILFPGNHMKPYPNAGLGVAFVVVDVHVGAVVPVVLTGMAAGC